MKHFLELVSLLSTSLVATQELPFNISGLDPKIAAEPISFQQCNPSSAQMCMSIGGTFDSATCICDLTDLPDDSTTDSTTEEASEDKSTGGVWAWFSEIDPFNLVGLVTPEMADLMMGGTSIGMFLLQTVNTLYWFYLSSVWWSWEQMETHPNYYWEVYSRIEEFWISANSLLTLFFLLQSALWGLHYFLDVREVNLAWNYFMEYLVYVQGAPALVLAAIKAYDNGHNNGVWHTMALLNTVGSCGLLFLKLNMLENFVRPLSEEEVFDGDENPVEDEPQDESTTDETNTDETQEEAAT